MIPFLLLSLSLLPGQEPEAPAPPGLARYRACVERFASAQALELRGLLEFRQSAGEGEPKTLGYDIDLRAFRGPSGRMELRAPEMDMHLTMVGDGENVYLLDHEEKTAMIFGEDFSTLAEIAPLDPFQAWADDAPAEPGEIEVLESPPGLPLLTGLRYRSSDGLETLWLAPNDRLVAASLEMGEDGSMRLDLVLTGSRILDQADPAAFAAEVPHDYTLQESRDVQTDFEAALLAIGEKAPDFEVRTLDGEVITLADLEGKTVLLNFWFRH